MKKMIKFSLLFAIICSLHIPFTFSYDMDQKESDKTEKHVKSSRSRHKRDCQERCHKKWDEEFQLDQPSVSKYRGKRLLKMLDFLGLDTETLQNLGLSEEQIGAIKNIVICNV